ncbi:MAG: RidA family protein [Bryobacteraceae bacterium]
MHRYLFVIVSFLGAARGADLKVITPAGARPPVGPYSPGIMAGDYLYVSGQGAAKADGTFPDTAEQQVEQCLNNVKAIVEGAGLTMEHVVYAQLYLKDITRYEDANRVWAKFFPKDPPARATIGVAKMPTDTPVEVSVTAVRDMGRRKSVGPKLNEPVSAGVMAGDRLYFSGVLGRDSKTGNVPPDPAQQVQLALDQLSQTLEAADMDFSTVVFVNPYLTDKMPMDIMNKIYATRFEFGNTPARATIKVASLPSEANIEFTGVAIRNVVKRIAVRPKTCHRVRLPARVCSPTIRFTARRKLASSRSQQRYLCIYRGDSGSANHAQPLGRARGGGADLRQCGRDQRLPGQHQ